MNDTFFKSSLNVSANNPVAVNNAAGAVKWRKFLSSFLLSVIAAALAGVAASAAFAPLDWWAVMPLALALLFYLAMRANNAKQAFGLGLTFGFFFFACGLFWLFEALSGYIGFPLLPAAVVMIIFCLFLAVFPASALAAGQYTLGSGRPLSSGRPSNFGQPTGNGLRTLAFAACWALSEWLRSWLFTGFPWLSIGYSQIPGGLLTGWVPFVGIIGSGFGLALLAAALAELAGGRRRLGAVVMALLAVSSLPLSLLQTTASGTTTVSLLQGNVAQKLKWRRSEVEKALADYQDMVKNASGKILIFPETALPMLIEDLPDGYVESLKAAAAERNGAVIAGLFLQNDNHLYNAAVALQANAQSDYRKSHLTPYGEYLPFPALLKPLLDAAGIPYNGLSPGKQTRPLTLPNGVVAGISICYEDAFGDEWRRQLPEANFLVNITNDAWFDGSAMARQHRQISQTRALETGRWLVRATNTGETAIINERGEVVASLPPYKQGTLTGEVKLFSGATPYVLIGDWGAVLAALLMLCGIRFVSWRRNK